LTVIFAVATGLGSAWAAHRAGISPALGAFAAGMFLGSSSFATQIRADVSSLRVVLLTLFFGTAGMVADPLWIFHNWYVVALVTVALMVGKTAIVWAIFALLRCSPRIALATGICLSQIGEFAFVLGNIGRTRGVVTDDLYALVVSVTIVSFLVSAFLVPRAMPIAGKIVGLWKQAEPPAERATSEEFPRPDVVIVGFGPAGQWVAHRILERKLTVIVIDLNREGVRRARDLGLYAGIGDATQSDVLQHVHIEHAKTVIITIPHHRSALLILEQVRQLAPLAHTIVRSRYQLHSDDFVDSGAHEIVGDEEEVGRRLGETLERWLDSVDSVPRPAET
jgi:CPA2 family monovalent cation:H+ antiporter-2